MSLLRFGAVAFLIILAASLLCLGVEAGASAATRPTQAEVAQSLTCQCGCGLTVANCNHPSCGFSIPVRQEIDRLIARGMSRAQIIASFRTRYGEKILSAPTVEGFNLVAWTMPFVALLAGALVVGFAMRRWRRAERASRQPTPTGAQSSALIDERLRRRLAEELRERI